MNPTSLPNNIPSPIANPSPRAAVIAVVISGFIFFVLGFALSQALKGDPAKLSPTNSANLSPANQTAQACLKVSPLFYTQQAFIEGKITGYTDSSISIEDKNGRKETFPASKNVNILNIENGKFVGSPSADLKAIKVNEYARIALAVIGGQYEVVNIQYDPALSNAINSSLPTSTPAATKK